MAITELDYKLQGPKLEKAVLDVYKRKNYIDGRYEMGGGFGLDFYSSDYQIENYKWITERAKFADEKIKEAESKGENINNPEVLSKIALEVDGYIKSGKRNGAWINYLVYLVIPGVIIWWLFF